MRLYAHIKNCGLWLSSGKFKLIASFGELHIARAGQHTSLSGLVTRTLRVSELLSTFRLPIARSKQWHFQQTYLRSLWLVRQKKKKRSFCLWLIGPVERTLHDPHLLHLIKISLQTNLPQREKLKKSRTVRVKRLVPYPWKFKANENCE